MGGVFLKFWYVFNLIDPAIYAHSHESILLELGNGILVFTFAIAHQWRNNCDPSLLRQ